MKNPTMVIASGLKQVKKARTLLLCEKGNIWPNVSPLEIWYTITNQSEATDMLYNILATFKNTNFFKNIYYSLIYRITVGCASVNVILACKMSWSLYKTK